MKDSLQVISASAGSGKTYKLTEILLAKVQSGEVALENLVAVTFTEAGAAELKGRIRAKLLSEGLFDEARKVDEAYISTIHAFGNRLLRELAFDLGLPLSTRMLNEDEQTQLIRSSMIDSDALVDMYERLDEFGYKTRMVGEQFITAEDEFRSQLKAFIDLLRSTGRKDAEQEFLSRSVAWLEKQYGAVDLSLTEELMAKLLHVDVMALLQRFPACPLELMEVTSKSGIAEFRASYRALEKAAKFTPLLSDWSLWVSLTRIRTKGQKKPKEPNQVAYFELANKVKETAAALLNNHPGPLRHAASQLQGMIRGAGETLEGYTRRKTDSKLVDFTDMVATAELALRNSSIRSRLTERIQMVVVDELQDTNPIQFAFLWHLIGAGVNAILVGDGKQSIMGFQGADPRLFNELVHSSKASVSSLDSNWRSQPELMRIINSFTQGLCKPEGMNMPYTPLDPKGKTSKLPALHMLILQDKPPRNQKKKINQADDSSLDAVGDSGAIEQQHPSENIWYAQQMAELIEKKLAAGLEIVDRRTGKLRLLRGADIAILCPTNGLMATYAAELESRGLAVNLERPNWYETSEVTLTIELLKLLDDPDDLHAKLYVACSDIGRISMQSALEQHLSDAGIDLPVFAEIEKLRSQIQGLLIHDIVTLLLEKVGLLNQIASWTDSQQARANVIKLIGLAREFSTAQPETLTSAGFYGRGIGTFIGWLNHLVQQGVAQTCPRASYNDEKAIELTTWHKSKGREWPVVVVCGMSKPPKVTVPYAEIGYEDFADFSALIQKSEIHFTPNYDHDTKREQLAQALRTQAEQVAMRELYVAISRPREQLILEWPVVHLEVKEDQKIKKKIQLLNTLADVRIEDKSVQINGQIFDAQIDRVAYQWKEAVGNRAVQGSAPVMFGRNALVFKANTEPRVSAQINPSVMPVENTGEPIRGSMEIRAEAYSTPLDLGIHAKANSLGTLVHRLVEVVMAGLDDVPAYRQRLESALLNHLDLDIIANLWAQAKSLKAHLTQQDETSSFASEVPVLGTLDGQSVVVGSMDLVVHGKLMKLIVDHKTDLASSDEAALWAKHKEQLAVYQSLNSEFEVVLNVVRTGRMLRGNK